MTAYMSHVRSLLAGPSDEAVEAAADLIVQGNTDYCECRRSPFDKHTVNPPCSTRREAMRVARVVLESAEAPSAVTHLLARLDAVEALATAAEEDRRIRWENNPTAFLADAVVGIQELRATLVGEGL